MKVNVYCLIVLFIASWPQSTMGQINESHTENSDFRVLFDGSSLDNWRGYGKEEIGKGWTIEGDTLHFDGSGGGDIITKDQFDNFELHFDWKVSEGGNSGIMYRVSLGDASPYISGPEYQILDDENHGDGRREITSAASLYGLVPPAENKLKPVGEWNHAKIVLKGDLIEHWLNETKVVSIEIGSDEWQEKLESSKFKDWEKFAKNKTGHIAFQDHGDPVWFRNIKIKSVSLE